MLKLCSILKRCRVVALRSLKLRVQKWTLWRWPSSLYLSLGPSKATTSIRSSWAISGEQLPFGSVRSASVVVSLPEARRAHERLLRRPVDKSGLASESRQARPSHPPTQAPLCTQGAAQAGTPPAPTSPLWRLHPTAAACRLGGLSTFLCAFPLRRR
jgi:hypothetical protein